QERAVAGETARGRIGAIPEHLHRRKNALAHLIPDVRLIVEHARNRLRGYPGFPRHVLDASPHRQPPLVPINECPIPGFNRSCRHNHLAYAYISSASSPDRRCHADSRRPYYEKLTALSHSCTPSSWQRIRGEPTGNE